MDTHPGRKHSILRSGERKFAPAIPITASIAARRDGAEGAVIQCSLHHAEDCGLHAQRDSRCTIVSSTIRENHIGGLFFSQDAAGLVEGNLIERNKINGIYIAAGANPRIRKNRIRHHKMAKT